MVFLVATILTGQAQAHVSLDFPNGGERLGIGSVVQIAWSDVVEHGPATYDLWYSTTGPDGPWVPIAGGLQPPRSFDWVVPDAASEQVRLRVKQDNDEDDYFDISDSNLAISAASESLEVILDAAKDATIYEDGNGGNANGSGSYLFTGRNASQGGSAERRALLAFPVSDTIPEGATVTSVSLELTMSKTISGEQTVGLHRLLEDWSEGPSDPSGSEGGGTSAVAGDATWMHREFSGSLWATPGGSFVATASGSLQVSGNGVYSFSSTMQMVADVQTWLDDPSSNFGWALVIDSPPSGSAKRFNSRENTTASSRPKLTIDYSVDVQELTADFTVTPANPRPGDVVRFSDQSTGEPTAWLWDFGDGQSSQVQNPNHTYPEAGSFTVQLTVSGATGDDSITKVVVVGSTVRRPSRRVAPIS
jgi:hypothetical protein